MRYDLCAIKINAYGNIEEGHFYVRGAVLSRTKDGIVNTQMSHANLEKDRPGHLGKNAFVSN